MKNFFGLKLNVLLKDKPNQCIIYLRLQLNWKISDLVTTGCLSWFRSWTPVPASQWHLGQTFIAKAEWWTFGELGCLLNTLSTQGFPYCRDWRMSIRYYPKNYLYPQTPKNADFVSFMQSLAICSKYSSQSNPNRKAHQLDIYDHSHLYYLNTELYLIEMILRLCISDDKFMATYDKFHYFPTSWILM